MQAWLYWTVQWVTVLGVVAVFLHGRRRKGGKEQEARLVACLNVVESRTEELDRSFEIYRRKMDDGLKRLAKICDKASALVDRGFEFNSFSASDEEKELRSIVPDTKGEIPSLEDVEKTRHRLREELKQDRSVLLRNQLS